MPLKCVKPTTGTSGYYVTTRILYNILKAKCSQKYDVLSITSGMKSCPEDGLQTNNKYLPSWTKISPNFFWNAVIRAEPAGAAPEVTLRVSLTYSGFIMSLWVMKLMIGGTSWRDVICKRIFLLNTAKKMNIEIIWPTYAAQFKHHT